MSESLSDVGPSEAVQAQWVNVYEVVRCYGGPQEGGWWWNHRECIASVPVCKGERPSAVVRRMRRHFADRAWGDIYSVRGGLEIDVCLEDEARESECLSSGGYQ